MTRGSYYVRRILVTILLIFGVATFLFFAFRAMPGDYATLLAYQGASPEELEQIRADWGLNQPLYVQYFEFMANMFTGDAGRSRVVNQSVVSYVLPRMANSIILVAPGLLFAFLLGSLYGGYLGTNAGSRFEKYGIFPPTFVGTMPDFFIAMVVIYLFSNIAGLLPSGGIATPETYQQVDTFWRMYLTRDFWYHYIAPFLAVTVKYLYYPALVMRGSVVEVSGKEFHRYEGLVGLPKLQRLRHLMKHASLPVITLLPPLTATAISGLVLIEIVFNWPGIGFALVRGVLSRDFPVVQFVFFLVAAWVILANFAVDILYGVIDPRVSVGETTE